MGLKTHDCGRRPFGFQSRSSSSSVGFIMLAAIGEKTGARKASIGFDSGRSDGLEMFSGTHKIASKVTDN